MNWCTLSDTTHLWNPERHCKTHTSEFFYNRPTNVHLRYVCDVHLSDVHLYVMCVTCDTCEVWHMCVMCDTWAWCVTHLTCDTCVWCVTHLICGTTFIGTLFARVWPWAMMKSSQRHFGCRRFVTFRWKSLSSFDSHELISRDSVTRLNR